MCWPRRCRSSTPARRSRSARRPRTASTTTSCASEPFSPEDLAKIEQRMAEIVDRDLPITREVWDRAKIKDHFEQHRRELQGRVGRRAARGRGDLGLQAGRLARPVPRPAPALDGQARQGLQADEGGGRLLARRCQQRPAPAHLRHGLLLRQGPRRPTCTASRKPRSATIASSAARWTCSISRKRRPAWSSGIPRAGRCGARSRTTCAASSRPAATSR